jgi:plasmid stabilization system protein ParE
MFEVHVQSEALLEIQEAFQWYESQQEDLGWKFISTFEEACRQLSLHPHHYASVNEHFRRIRMPVFPYLIVYEISQSDVFIIAVRHAARRPLIK